MKTWAMIILFSLLGSIGNIGYSGSEGGYDFEGLHEENLALAESAIVFFVDQKCAAIPSSATAEKQACLESAVAIVKKRLQTIAQEMTAAPVAD